jgi:hypothetical protein
LIFRGCWPSTQLRSCVEQGRHFAVVGKAAGGEFGIEELAVGNNLERSAGAGDDLNLGAIGRYKQVPRTEGTRLVVSSDAIFDSDIRWTGHV